MGVRGKSLDSGPPSAVFPNFQHRHASTLSAAPCPSTLLVSDPFSFSCNPILDSSCSLILGAMGITARWPSDPSKKGRVWWRGRFPSQPKGTHTDPAGQV